MSFPWRCLINCEKPASLSTPISLATTCEGNACDNVTYQWQLVTVHSQSGQDNVERLTRDMTQSDLDLPGLSIKANQLNGGLTYQLKVTASPDDGPAGNAAYQFEMNVPPQNGECTVSPKSGEALVTKFAVTCTGWQVRKCLFRGNCLLTLPSKSPVRQSSTSRFSFWENNF